MNNSFHGVLVIIKNQLNWQDDSNPELSSGPEVYHNPFSLGGERRCEVRPEVRGGHGMVTW